LASRCSTRSGGGGKQHLHVQNRREISAVPNDAEHHLVGRANAGRRTKLGFRDGHRVVNVVDR
jgi:hypothetical protein